MIGECVPNTNSIMTELLLLPHRPRWRLRTENHPRVAAPTSHSRLLRQSDSCLAVRGPCTMIMDWMYSRRVRFCGRQIFYSKMC